MQKNDLKDISFESYCPFHDFSFVEQVWTAMLAKCPHSFFLSWGWISTWLKTLPRDTKIHFIVGQRHNDPVVVLFLGAQDVRRHGIINSNAMLLNETGVEVYDDICLEYNNLLVDPKINFSVNNFLQLLPIKWDEFFLSAVGQDVYKKLIDGKIDNQKYNLVLDNVADVFLVDLEKVRANKMDYLPLLSAKTRQKIRRSIRAYEKKGEIQIEIASDRKSAQKILVDLSRLHEKSWKARGKTGAFSNHYFMKFHQGLIDSCYEKGELELIHIFNRHSTIGYLYNFIYNGDVLFYQCAFNFIENNKYSPGLTALVSAITLYAERGYSSFNFLAGNVQYKKSLSTDSETMYWVKVQKNRKRFVLETKLKELINRYPFWRRVICLK